MSAHFEQMTWSEDVRVGTGRCGACGALWPCPVERDDRFLRGTGSPQANLVEAAS